MLRIIYRHHLKKDIKNKNPKITLFINLTRKKIFKNHLLKRFKTNIYIS